MSQIEVKRGDTFSLVCTYKVDGVTTDVTDLTIRSQLRKSNGVLIQELTVTKLGTVGDFTLTATATQAESWPLSLLNCDIEISENNLVRSSSTFFVAVNEDITR